MELDPLPPQPVLDTASLPSVIGQDREKINEPEATAEEKFAKLLDEQMCEQVALLERTPLHKLAEVLPLVLERIRQLATKDSNILHQGSVISRLSFPNTTVDMLRELKIFGGSTSTWQWIDNPSTHTVRERKPQRLLQDFMHSGDGHVNFGKCSHSGSS